MKSILVHVSGDKGFKARMQVALDIARVFGSKVTFLQSIQFEFYAPGDFYGTALAAAMPNIKAAAADQREAIEADLANEDVDWEWVQREGVPEFFLLEQSAIHDLILVGDHDPGEKHGPSRMAGELALTAKCPVLVVPESAESFDPTAPVMVGWNGSVESCVALKWSTPLLAKSAKVFLGCVKEEKKPSGSDFPSLSGLQYLSRYGVEAELVEFPASDDKPAHVLEEAARSRGCGLLVIGAYGHSRLSEMLLGGVTRSILSDPKQPVLIAH